MNAHNFAHVCLTAQWWIPPRPKFSQFPEIFAKSYVGAPSTETLGSAPAVVLSQFLPRSAGIPFKFT